MKIHSNKGVTLTELMTATFVSTVALFSIIGAFVKLSILNEFNRDQTLAIVHAQHIMEEIKDTHFGGLEAAINSGTFNLATSQLSTGAYSFAPLASETVNTSVVSSGNPLRILVRVSWLTKGQRARTYTLETLRTRGS